ncbi:PDZ and LIM domain protein 3 [Eumeta japonica]|uniref:PDZ and LIM domain protein 3 n=1 Tax=Eumeta variegata TaxID=151549 RepID=A0A4C1Y452_EUMVA|nr:PDZ and LIM domain protein 3 [Eumeta japonica]
MDEIYSRKHKLPKALEQELRKGLRRPSWESRNEGVQEKVNFDDTIWGFELAGGAAYDTPLRVTTVRKNSRAERVGIKPGDLLIGINGMETNYLTVQEAHDMILESGLHIKLAVTAPDVEETAYYVWEDELEDDSQEKQIRHEIQIQQQKKLFKGAKTDRKQQSSAWVYEGDSKPTIMRQERSYIRGAYEQASKREMITATHEHSQTQRNHQCVSSIVGKNRIRDGGGIGGEGMA